MRETTEHVLTGFTVLVVYLEFLPFDADESRIFLPFLSTRSSRSRLITNSGELVSSCLFPLHLIFGLDGAPLPLFVNMVERGSNLLEFL